MCACVCVYVCVRAFGTASDIIMEKTCSDEAVRGKIFHGTASDISQEMTCSDEAVRGKIFHVAAKSTAGAAVVSKLLPVLCQLCKLFHWRAGEHAGQCNYSTRVACWAISSQ